MSEHSTSENTSEAVLVMASTAPHWVAVISIVSLFVWYLYSLDQTSLLRAKEANRVADLRIDQCQTIQLQSITALDRVADICGKQSEAFVELRHSLDHKDK